MRKFIIIALGIFLIPFVGKSQIDKNKNADLDRLIQDIFQQQNDDVSYEDFYEVLFQYYTNPIDLNKTEREDLESLYLLNLVQLNSFFDYRKTNGPFVSIYELQAIPNFDLNTIRNLLPFVEINFNPFGIKGLRERMSQNKNKYFLTRYEKALEEKKGYQMDQYGHTAYTGSPFKMYIRYRNSISRDFSIGITLEKDAGEQIIWDPKTHRYLADYISFHASFFNKGKIKALCLGDYQLQFGQGLIMGAGFYIGKGAETITTIKRNNTETRPYTSSMESGFFRGIATTYELNRCIDISAFYSNTNRDANTKIDSLSGTKEEVIASLNDYGYHRTFQEINNKSTLNQQVFGYNFSFVNKERTFHVGNTMAATIYNTNIKESDRIYNRFDFTGSTNYTLGADYSYIFRNFNFFGEMALSKGGGYGLVTGLISSLSPKIDFSLLYRNYSKDFHSFYGISFSENTDLTNEQGLYAGIKIKPAHQWTISAYYDVFYFPWLKYMTDSPSEGYGYMTRIQWNPTRKITLYAQLRYENKEKNQSDNITHYDFVVPNAKYNYMFNMDYKAAEFITFRTRIMGSSYRQSNAPTFGYAIFEDLIFDMKKINISSRFSIFDTDDYDNRQYVYEKDVLYAVSIPEYDGQGVRTYLLFNYSILKNLDIWIRYSITKYYDRKTISSGFEEIQGDSKSEIKVQLRYKF